MLSRLLICKASDGLMASRLLDERTFYPQFKQDLAFAKHEVVIESPFITRRRVAILMPLLRQLRHRGVGIVINTRQPQEHEELMRHEAEASVINLQDIGVQVLYTGGHHRKLVIIDRKILYEGSLNVLSQNESCEIMRRIESEQLAKEMVTFTNLSRFLT